MTNRFTTARSTEAIRRWRAPAIVTLAATAALTALTVAPPAADAAGNQGRPARTSEATAPRDAGEPIMAIVSIKSQQVTIYDADGWDPARASVDRHDGTRDPGRCLQRRREGQGPPLEPL
jgi:hypothetical protein